MRLSLGNIKNVLFLIYLFTLISGIIIHFHSRGVGIDDYLEMVMTIGLPKSEIDKIKWIQYFSLYCQKISKVILRCDFVRLVLTRPTLEN